MKPIKNLLYINCPLVREYAWKDPELVQVHSYIVREQKYKIEKYLWKQKFEKAIFFSELIAELFGPKFTSS